MPDGRRALALFLLAVLLTAVPAAAQNNSAATVEIPPPPAPRADTVGPEQLRDFSLPGTATRPTEQPAAPARTGTPPPAASTPQPQPRSDTGRTPAVTSSAAAPRTTTAPVPPAAEPAPATPPNNSSPAPALTLDLPPPTPAPDVAPVSAPPSLPEPESEPASSGSPFAVWPWVLAALAVAGAALFWFRRRRGAESGRYGELAFAGAAPAPEPARVPPAPRPTPAPPPLRPASETPPAPPPVRPTAELPPAPPPITGGIVSTRLRPWVDLEFAPIRAVLTETEALVEFDLLAVNSGSVPARDVVIEGVILNAGAEQEQELAAFFARPQASAQGIEVIPPLGRVPMRSQVRLPRAGIREYAVEDRRLFVPVVAFNAAYRWSGGTGRTSASFLVGLGQAGAEKLGPFRVDQGEREWRGLAAKLLPSGERR